MPLSGRAASRTSSQGQGLSVSRNAANDRVGSEALVTTLGAADSGIGKNCNHISASPWHTPQSSIQRRAKAAGIETKISNHTFRATGITAYLKNGGTLEHAQQIANHASPRTTKFYDRRSDEISLDEVEKISI
jgi:integrase